MTPPTDRRPDRRPGRGPSLRTILTVTLGGPALYAAVLAIAVTLTFQPRLSSVQDKASALLTEFRVLSANSALIDQSVEDARSRLSQGDLAGAAEAIRETLDRGLVFLTASSGALLSDVPGEMRNAISTAIEAESIVRSHLSVARAHLELGELAPAVASLNSAEMATSRLVGSLAEAQRAGLEDVVRRGSEIENAARGASRALLVGAGVGLLIVLVATLVLRRRVLAPLKELDAAMRALASGELGVQVAVRADDEIGRVASMFNQFSGVIEARDTERRSVTRRTLDAAIDAVVTIDPDGVIIAWNPSAARILGWPRSEAVGLLLHELIIPPELREAHLAGLRRIREGGELRVMNRRVEMQALRRDGTTFTAELAVVPVEEEGRIVAFTAFMRDVTEQRSAEEAMRRSEQLLRGVLDNANAVIAIKDLECRYRIVNRRFAEVSGQSVDSLIGRRASDVAPGPEADAAETRDRAVLAAGHAEQFEENFESPTGWRSFVTVRFPLLDGAGEAYALGLISTELTDMIHLQDQVRRSQRLEAVGRLAGGIAHDFNNLMTVILGQVQLAAEFTEDEEILETLGEVEKAATRAGGLTGQLLSFARKQIIAPKVVQLNALVEDSMMMIHPAIESTIRLDVHLHPDTGAVSVDEGHFSQVLVNLVMNARDAMGAAGGAISLRTGFVALAQPGDPDGLPPGTYAELTVSDEGPGFAPGVLEHVFEPFFTTKESGTGLGLATCHGIVTQAGGTITARNRSHGGAIFRVLLPRVPSRGMVAP